MQQGTDEWLQARAGKITASRVGDLVKRKKDGGFLAAGTTYLDELLGERITGKPAPSVQTYAMKRGSELEEEARTAYSLATDTDVVELGMVSPEGFDFVGASPDGLVGDDGLVEIKCPLSHSKHINNLLNDQHAEDYKWQIQCQLWATGRDWCDAVSYHPDFAEFGTDRAVFRVTRDDGAIEQIKQAAASADDWLNEQVAKLESLRNDN